MLLLHYFLVITLGIHQSHGFLPLELRKLNLLRHTSMVTKYVKNITEKNDIRSLSAFFRSTKPALKHSGTTNGTSLFKVLTSSPKVKLFKANRYGNGKLKSTRFGTDGNARRTLPYDGNTEKRTITLPENLFKDVTDETIRILVTEDELKVLPYIAFRSKTTRLNKSLNYITKKPLKLITVNKESDLENYVSETIGPIRVLIEDDTNFEPKNRTNVVASKDYFFTTPSHYDHIISDKEQNDLGNDEVIRKNNQVIISDDIHLKPIGIDVLVARTSPSSRRTTPLLNTTLVTEDLQPDDIVTDPDGNIGPIRVIAKEDTNDYEADYTSVTKKLHNIAFFDITEETVDYDNRDISPHSIRVTRTSPYYRRDRVTKTAKMSSVPKVSEINDSDKTNRINLDDLEAEYKNDAYIEEEDFTIIPKVTFTLGQILKTRTNKLFKFPIISTLWPAITENMSKFPFSSSQTSYLYSTQKRYGEESELNATLPYFLYNLTSTWPILTVRNYFGEHFTTQERGGTRKNAQYSETDTHFTKNVNEVTMQINILTKHILSPGPRKFIRPRPRKTTPRKALKMKKKPWHCYECGMDDTQYGEDRCHKLFHVDTFGSGRDTNYYYLRRKYQKECKGNQKYFGQCFYRYLDIGTQYVERGCRDWPPRRGHTYASRLFHKLEYLMKKRNSGCVSSPHAVLMPFSKNIQLYSYVNVCICEGRFCNDAAAIEFDWIFTLLSIILLTLAN